MNTTNYVLELLIAGISTFLWIILLSIAFWGNDVTLNFESIQNSDKILVGLFFAPIIYVVGIINDRIVDNLFDRLFKLRLKYFPDIKKYRQARSAIYVNSETLTNLFEYGRMRIRICRNWTINGTFIFLSTIIFIWSESATKYIENNQTKIEISIAFSIIMILSIYASFASWKDLNKKEFEFLKIQSEILEKIEPAANKVQNVHSA